MKLSAHRILYTGDCNYLFATDQRPPGERKGPYTVKVLDDHADVLAANGVDTHLINPNGQRPWYPSKVHAGILDGYTRGDRTFSLPHYPPLDDTFTQEMLERHIDRDVAMLDRYLDLAEAGIDWIAHLAEACRERGVTPWATVRMNDAHGANNWQESYFNCPPQADPALCQSGKSIDIRRGPDHHRAVCNFEHKAVRDYYFAMIRELIEDYQFEGIELDWLRTPLCCEPPASEETIAILTEWHARIAELAQRESEKRGKPYPVGIRIPSRLGSLRTAGLDVEAMTQRGILDFVGLSNFWQTTWDLPYDRLRERLGNQIALYGVIEGAPNWLFAQSEDGSEQGYRLLSTSAEFLRGNAAGKLAMGVDGIEFFNFFCADASGVHPGSRSGSGDYATLHDLSDLDRLRGKPKQYTLSTSYNFWAFRFFEAADQLPACIAPGAWHGFRLSMCAEPAPNLQCIVQLVLERRYSGSVEREKPELGVSLNGSWPTFAGHRTDALLFPTGQYSHHIREHEAWDYVIDRERIRDGWNEITVYHSDDFCDPRPGALGEPIRIVSVEVALIPER